MTAALKLVDLTVSYDRHPAVHHLSAEIAAAEMTAIVGPNGAGKSSLLKAMLGLAPRIEGRIECSATRIAYLPQQAEIDRSFPISVLDTVLLGRWSRFGGFGKARQVDIHDARHAIERVGWAASSDGRSTRCPSASSSARCSRVCCCRTPTLSCWTSRLPPSMPGPSST